MRLSHFFIDRPIFALVISVIVTLLGLFAYPQLPLSQYPEIAPPTVAVSAAYPGATAEDVAEQVAAPLEQEINGVEGMLYMTSSATADGMVQISVTFQPGTDIDTAQVKVQNEDPRQSTTEMKGSRVFDAVETFYQQSEQRRARIFELGDEEFFMISAQPDCDEEWLEALTPEGARNLENDETLSLLETRKFRFECGCNLERIYPAIAPLASQGLDELFQGDEAITVTCPRCNAKWRLTREQIEAVMN